MSHGVLFFLLKPMFFISKTWPFSLFFFSRLPGESQKVDRLVSSFAECYVNDNRDNPSCPFSNSDTPFILSFAIIMLNTDLHR